MCYQQKFQSDKEGSGINNSEADDTKDDDDDNFVYNGVNVNETKELITINIHFFPAQHLRNASPISPQSSIHALVQQHSV